MTTLYADAHFETSTSPAPTLSETEFESGSPAFDRPMRNGRVDASGHDRIHGDLIGLHRALKGWWQWSQLTRPSQVIDA